MSSTPKHLEPSELGTREYWDKLYTAEMANHAANPDDVGTVWFDDSDAQEKMLEYLALLADGEAGPDSDLGSDAGSESPDSESPDSDRDTAASSRRRRRRRAATKDSSIGDPTLSKQTASFLDLGCGNGSILFALRAAGWAGPLAGVDYSAHSIALARQVASSSRDPGSGSGSGSGSDDIQFAEWDVLRGPDLSTVVSPCPPSSSSSPFPSRPASTAAVNAATAKKTWDVVLDKGTFDAISLSDATDGSGRRVCEAYKDRVLPLLSPGGLFLITSCNWTEEELRSWFVTQPGAAGAFQEAGRVKYRTFSFGGVQGQTISTLCFRKL